MAGLAESMVQQAPQQGAGQLPSVDEVIQMLMQGVPPEELEASGIPPELIMQAIQIIEQLAKRFSSLTDAQICATVVGRGATFVVAHQPRTIPSTIKTRGFCKKSLPGSYSLPTARFARTMAFCAKMGNGRTGYLKDTECSS